METASGRPTREMSMSVISCEFPRAAAPRATRHPSRHGHCSMQIAGVRTHAMSGGPVWERELFALRRALWDVADRAQRAITQFETLVRAS